MPVKTNLTRFDSPIIHIQPLNFPAVGVVTASHDVYLYYTETQTTEKFVHLNLPEEGKLLCAFDPEGMLLLFGLKEGRTLHIIDLMHKKIVNRFELDQQSPTSLAFSPDASYVVCGTDQGRVFLWRSHSSTLVSRLHSFPEFTSFYTRPKVNYVSALSFEGKLLATSGYGGSVVVTDYLNQTASKRYHPGIMQIHALLFYNNFIIAGNHEGTLTKIDRNGKQNNQRLPTKLGPIGGLVKIGSGPHLLAFSGQRTIVLINAETFKIVHERYYEFDSDITALSKNSVDEIYIATASGELFFSAPYSPRAFDDLIDAKAYAQAYKLCQQDPLLEEGPGYRLLEGIFQSHFEKARSSLEKGQNEQAKLILQPFAAAKPKEIKALFNDFAYYKRMVHLFENRRLAPFYGLADHYPHLKYTAIYRQTEKIWEERFTKAQKLMLLGRAKEAYNEVESFAVITTKRPFIELLIHHFDVFKNYSKALQQRNYPLLNALIQRYPVLKRLPSYMQLIEEAGELTDATREALMEKEFAQAQLFITQLEGIVQYEEAYRSLKDFLTKAMNLAHAIERNLLRSAYQLLDAHPELLTLPWAAALEDKWHQKLRQGELYAAKGNIALIKKEFGKLITQPGRYERIGDILRMGYQVQLKILMRNHPDLFATGVLNYCQIFGIDTELRHLLKKARRNKLEVSLDPLLLHPKKRDHWLTCALTLPERLTQYDTMAS